MIDGPYGDIKYLGYGNFFFKDTLMSRNFKHLLIIAEGVGLMNMLTVLCSECQIVNGEHAMDVRVLYYVEEISDIVNLEMIISYHSDNLANFLVVSSDSAVENILDEEGRQIGHVGELDQDHIEGMAPLPNEDSLVMVDVAMGNKARINELLLGMNFKENQIINY
jgi:NAD(P)H-flavin reductase